MKNRKRSFLRSRTLVRGLLSLALLGMVSGCGADLGVLHPDLVLLNGKIVTVDEDFSIAEAVAIKDGKFVAVGSNAQIRNLVGDRTEVFDLEGETVLPGFNDPHLHFAHSLGFVADESTQKFRSSTSIQEILAMVQEKIDQTPPGELVWFSWDRDPMLLKKGVSPTARIWTPSPLNTRFFWNMEEQVPTLQPTAWP